MSYFLCHGSPMLAIEESPYSLFLDSLGQSMNKPEGIIMFSAHWETRTPTITYTDDTYATIHDFFGFPPELYQVYYPAKGSTQMATKVRQNLEKNGWQVKFDAQRGLDHGAWVILKHLFPQADIPVVQISINPFLPLAKQYQLGEALKDLDQEGLLVIGSGGTVHNLGEVRWGRETAEPWAVQFDDWLIDKVLNKDLDALFHFDQLAPYAQKAVPRNEHLVPLYIALGSGSLDKPHLLYRGYEHGTVSLLGFQF